MNRISESQSDVTETINFIAYSKVWNTYLCMCATFIFYCLPEILELGEQTMFNLAASVYFGFI